MDRRQYLSDPYVQAFLDWANMELFKPGALALSWKGAKGSRGWCCSSLADAYQRYFWRGLNFNQTGQMLGTFRRRFQGAGSNRAQLNGVAKSVMKWGGTSIAGVSLDNFLADLSNNRVILNPGLANTNHLNGIKMNATLSKLYHCTVSDFPIYDGRVGAALGYLVRCFLKSQGISAPVPPALRFAWSGGKSTRMRNPSKAGVSLPTLRSNTVAYTRTNLRAAWLLDELAKHPALGNLAPPDRMRALEAGLFMIGYDLSGYP